MTNIAAAQLGAMSSAAGHALAGPQPAAQHVARFEQQLQAPAAAAEPKFYESPSVRGSGSWGAMTDGLGQVAEQFRTDSAALRAGLEGSVSSVQTAGPAQRLEVWRHEMSELSRMSYSMMNISLVTSAERLAGENVRSLFQIV